MSDDRGYYTGIPEYITGTIDGNQTYSSYNQNGEAHPKNINIKSALQKFNH